MPTRGPAASSGKSACTARQICVSSSTHRNRCSFAGSPSSRPPCGSPPRAVACMRSRRTLLTSRPSSTSSTGTAPSSPPNLPASEVRASSSSTRHGSCFATHWTASDSVLRGKCENACGSRARTGGLEALLLFFDFLPRPFLLGCAFLPPPASNRAPLAGLDLAPRIHPEDEQDDDADHTAVDCPGLPRWLTNVHGERRAVLWSPPCVRFRRVVDVDLERLV